MPEQDDLAILSTLLQKAQLEPFITHIRFPRYKNLTQDTRIDFRFPITALVGANGTNKSSVLRALQGSPGFNNLGNYWFSTEIDPIAETGDRPNCFIYGYHNLKEDRPVEVLKTRIKKAGDPDYWEPSRGLVRYGMERFKPTPGSRRTRWPTIKKDVVYIDFRQSLSAFDKFFYQSEPRLGQTIRDRKNLVRGQGCSTLLTVRLGPGWLRWIFPLSSGDYL